MHKFVVLLCVVTIAGCAAEPGAHQPATEHAGQLLFERTCAACHGADARGTGPVAQFLTVPVPDLTQVAARRGGNFPELEIFRIIDGQSDLAVHGPRHMPVWGYEFFGTDADDEVAHRQATDKVDSLVAYLRSIQR